jgi:hypothetical protein
MELQAQPHDALLAWLEANALIAGVHRLHFGDVRSAPGSMR